jgi:hypothetical protein
MYGPTGPSVKSAALSLRRSYAKLARVLARGNALALTDRVVSTRLPVTFGTEDQHGTELWKYMTQYTFRLS